MELFSWGWNYVWHFDDNLFNVWGKVNEIAIQGVQGRYFTGVILLLGLTFNSIKLFVPVYPTLSPEEEKR